MLKNQLNRLVLALAGIILSFVCTEVNAQVQTPRYISMTGYSNAYYEYLPQGYNSTSSNYPLIIFFHGTGECGDGSVTNLPKVLRNGTPKQINQGIFPTYFISNADTCRFIVISPQFILSPTPQDVSNVIDYVVSHYRVDINRIYLTGLSMGGGNIWDYCQYSMSNSLRIAAIVPICGHSWPTAAGSAVMAAANLSVWGTHNQYDGTVPSSYTIDYTNYINSSPQLPLEPAKRTIFQVGGHDAWTKTYDLTYKEDSMNVYEWMLKHHRSFTTLPVTGLNFNASKNNSNILLNWSITGGRNNSGFEVEKSLDGRAFSNIGFVNNAAAGGTAASFSFTDVNVAKGKNFYRLKQVDVDGHFTYSIVRFVDMNNKSSFTIYPNPVGDILNINTGRQLHNVMVTISDMKGRILRNQSISGTGTFTFEVSNIPSGNYNVIVAEGSEKTVLKMIKQ